MTKVDGLMFFSDHWLSDMDLVVRSKGQNLSSMGRAGGNLSKSEGSKRLYCLLWGLVKVATMVGGKKNFEI